MLKACVTYIKPILEYNSVLWSLDLVYLVDSSESVKRKFTKRNNSLASVSYSDRLYLLNLQSSTTKDVDPEMNYFNDLSVVDSIYECASNLSISIVISQYCTLIVEASKKLLLLKTSDALDTIADPYNRCY